MFVIFSFHPFYLPETLGQTGALRGKYKFLKRKKKKKRKKSNFKDDTFKDD